MPMASSGAIASRHVLTPRCSAADSVWETCGVGDDQPLGSLGPSMWSRPDEVKICKLLKLLYPDAEWCLAPEGYRSRMGIVRMDMPNLCMEQMTRSCDKCGVTCTPRCEKLKCQSMPILWGVIFSVLAGFGCYALSKLCVAQHWKMLRWT